MDKKHLKLTLLGVVAVGAVAAVVSLVRHFSTGSGPINEKERIAKMMREDKQTLDKKEAEDAAVFGALVRLSMHQDPIAHREALARANNRSLIVRQAAATALGQYDDEESLTQLRRLADDSETPVRVNAVRAMGDRPSAKKLKFLQEISKKSNLTIEEKIALHASLYKANTQQEGKQAALGELISMARTTTTADMNLRAALQALSLSPMEPRVLELLREFLKSGKTPSMNAVAIHHLAVVGDSWLKSNFGQLASSKDVGTQVAILQTLAFICPKDRWNIILGAIQNPSSPALITPAINAVAAMPSSEAQSLLESVLKTGLLKDQNLDLAKQTLASLKRDTRQDPCLAKAAQASSSQTTASAADEKASAAAPSKATQQSVRKKRRS